MKVWNYALYTSIAAIIILLIIPFLPGHYSIFVLNKHGFDAGKLFPVMLCVWSMALVAFALNNVFADKSYIDNNLKMHTLLKYLPSLLGIPVLLSFVWFLYSWFKEIQTL